MDEPTDFEAVFARIEEALTQDPPDLQALHAIRGLLADTAFIPELKGYIERHRKTNLGSAAAHRFWGWKYLAEDQRERHETTAKITMPVTIGGGTSLFIGSIFAAVTLGPVALIPAFGGLATFAIGYATLRRVDPLRSVYRQIAERLDDILNKLDA